MTDIERFTQAMAEMMGKHIHNWEIHFSDSLGSYGYKYFTCSCGTWEWSKTPDWSPITPEGELTPEVRKWWIKNLERPYREYLRSLELSDAIFTQEAQLSWRNLWKWMRENTDSWLYRGCMYKCGMCGKKDCKYYGIGKVAKWNVEKWLEVGIGKSSNNN